MGNADAIFAVHRGPALEAQYMEVLVHVLHMLDGLLVQLLMSFQALYYGKIMHRFK